MKKFEVVVSGISGRFPDCDDIQTFKRKLYDGEDFISFDERKWSSKISYELGKKKLPKGTGKFHQIRNYDAMVFKMNRLFARNYDTVNRTVLEPSFEAIVDAGINPYTLAGQNIGVFTSFGINETYTKFFEDVDKKISMVAGCNKTMMANRISFAFDLRGPSLAFAGDIYGSMDAFVAGYHNIANGYIDAAIVGVCSNHLEPALEYTYLNMNVLSADSCSRIFSKDANGYARSESCVIFYLQKAEDAKRIYANINLCDSSYTGFKNGTLIQYNENHVSKVIEKFYQENEYSVKPSDVAFVEMNACGIKRLDSIESNAVEKIFCKNRESPLLVGSIKSNVGHTESAAPFMSLLKGILALESNIIAPNINVNEIDMDIKPLATGTLQVVSSPNTLPGDRIAVNSISLAGDVGHTVLQRIAKKQKRIISDNLPRLLLVCGRSEAALTSAIKEVRSKPFDPEFIALSNDVFHSEMPFHFFRGFTILPASSNSVQEVQMLDNQEKSIWYLYTGMGSQWNCMGHGLLNLPIFAEVVKRCDAVLKPYDVDIYNVLTSDDPNIFNDIINSFVGIITIQIGLTEILKALGLQPDGIIGHSVGENGCAYADGCLTLEQAVLASYARGMASSEIQTEKGMMAAVGKGYNEMKDSVPGNIEIACHNSSFSCTLSGPAEEVETFVKQLKEQKIFAKSVNVANIAYHSKYIAPAGPKLADRLTKIIPTPIKRSSKWISTSLPETRWEEPLAEYCSAEYLTNNLLSPVLFEEGCKHIPENAIVIEIAPHGLLQSIVKKSLSETCLNIPLTRRSETKENLNFLLSSLGKLYIAGCDIDVNQLYPEIPYPVSSGTLPISTLCTWDRTAIDTSNIMMERHLSKPLWDDLIHVHVNDDSEYAYLNNHKVNHKIIIPMGLYIYLTWWNLSILQDKELKTIPVLFEDIKIHKIVKLSLKKPKSFYIMIQISGNFEIVMANGDKQDRCTVVASGKVSTEVKEIKKLKEDEMSWPSELKMKIEGKQFLNLLAQYEYQLSECFSNVSELCDMEPDYYSTVLWQQNWVTFLNSLMNIQLFQHIQKGKILQYPFFLRKLFIHNPQNIINSKDAITCHYNANEKILRCDGLEMFDLKFKTFPKKFIGQCNYESKFQAYQFVEYSNPLCQNRRSFLKTCLQIIAQHLALTFQTENEKLCILGDCVLLFKTATKLVKENHFLKTRTIFRSETEITASLLDSCKCILKMADHQYFENGLHHDQLFLILMLPDFEEVCHHIESNFVEILKQSIGDKKLFFYKKKSMKSNSTYPALVEEEHSNSSNKSRSINSQDVVVVRRNIETEDISLILNEKQKYTHRVMYIMDDKNSIPENNITLNKEFLNLDLPISILKNGQCGFYKNVTEEVIMNNNFNKNEDPKSFSKGVMLKEVTVLHFHLQNDLADQTKFLEYMGINSSGEQIIGITPVDSFETESQIQPNFTWTIPEMWNSEDVSLVPAAYALAYYIMKLEKSEVRYNVLLINMGKEYFLTEAIISVALSLNVLVYVTTSNSRESEVIKEIFPEINEDHILSAENCLFERELLLSTGGKGASRIINCLSGIKNFIATWNCNSINGYFVEIGKQNFSHFNEMGLFPFKNSTSFYAITNKISVLFKLHPEDQNWLKNSMQAGIDKGIVKPFSNLWKELEQPEILSQPLAIRNSSSLRAGRTKKLLFGSDYSYIIVGSEKDSLWVNSVEWLISKGALKFIIVVHNLASTPNISYQLSKLISEKSITVILEPIERLNSIEDANELLNEAEKIGPLEAIFFVHAGALINKIQNVDEVLRARNQPIHVISIFSGGLKECEARRSHGFPAIVLHGDCPNSISSTFSCLDEILANFDTNSPTLYKVVDTNSEPEKEILCFDPHNHCPTDLEWLEDIGYSVTKRTEFKEMTSLSLSYKESIGVYPIFIIPSVQGHQLQHLIRKLVYPVFCATLSESGGSAAEIALDLFGELNKIQPTGPVTVIGETWSAVIACELSNIINQKNRNCKMFIIDGNPKVWKNRLLTLGPSPSTQFDFNFLKNTFNMTETFEAFTQLGNTFENRLKSYFTKYPSKEFNAYYLTRALISLRHRLTAAAEYKLSEFLWKNTIFFSQEDSEDFSMKLSVHSSIIVKEETDYNKFVQDTQIISTINENSLYSWWDYTNVNKCF